MLRRMHVIALGALIVSACSTSREATSSKEQLRVESVETVQKVDSVVVAIRDTVREVTTIHIQTNEVGDTLKVAQVTERDRIRDRAQVNDRSEMVRVVRDTVFIEKRDSVSTTTNFTNGTNPKSSKNAIVQGLKWIFWIIVAVIALMIVVRIRGRP